MIKLHRLAHADFLPSIEDQLEADQEENRGFLMILQSFMGHRDYKSTEIYTRVFALDVAGQLGVRFEMTPEHALQLLGPNR